MPYVFVEELDEGQVEADVIERETHDGVLESLRNAEQMRDEAISRAEQAEADLRKQKEKYANTFLSKKPEPHDPIEHPKPDIPPQSISDLF